MMKVLRNYKADSYDLKWNMLQIFTNFRHVLKRHNDDKSFEIICSRLGIDCNINQCHIFYRYSIDGSLFKDKTFTRKLYDLGSNYDEKQLLYHLMLDKMHCYYAHSYDTRHRFTTKQKKIIKNIKEEDYKVRFCRKSIFDLDEISEN